MSYFITSADMDL